MRFGIDINEVLYDFVGEFARFIHGQTGKPLADMPKPSAWDFAGEWGLTGDEWLKHFHAFEGSGAFRHGDPKPDAVRVLGRLSEGGHRVTLITARGCERGSGMTGRQNQVRGDTLHWLARHAIPHHDLFFTNDKPSLRADVFLDDAEHHLIALEKAGVRGVCFNAGHNQGWRGERVRDWREFERLVLR